MSTAIVWFRQDLRIRDNPALAMACKNHQKLILLYIKSQDSLLGEAQHWWLHHSLQALTNSLSQVPMALCLRTGDPCALFKELIAQYSIEAVYWNRCYEPLAIARDKKSKAELKAAGVEVNSYNGSLLHEPWEILTQNHSYYKVFTPYWRQCLKESSPRALITVNQWPICQVIPSETLLDWKLLPTKPNWASEFAHSWQPGEEGAHRQLDYFVDQHLHGYQQLRNIPIKNATSRLSPHLHFGELSPQQIWVRVQEATLDHRINSNDISSFLSELGWREFSYQLLYHFPQLMAENFKAQFDHFTWENNESYFTRWKKGLTGYPLVDAGMRELWRTGYMHNRVRMIVASFLTKHLRIDWRKGADWFWNTLLDADLANNSASWQWVAGSGADAAPYYRIFNPILQSEKFDPKGEYIKKWVPELSTLSTQWIHQPWAAPKGMKDYPAPMVEHSIARQRALEEYQRIKNET